MTSWPRVPVRLLFAVLTVIGLVAVSCGDDGGGTSTEAFCAALEDQEANEDLDLDNPEDLAAFNALVDEAPEEIRGSMEELREVTEQFEDLDEDDPAAFGAVFALFGNADFLRAVQELSIFMADECGLEVEGIDELRAFDPDDPAALFEGFGDTGDGGDDSGATGSDEAFETGSGDADDEPSNSELLGVHLDENYADTAWADEVVSKAIGSFGDSADITLSLDDGDGSLTEDDAVEACEAVDDWASGQFDGDVTVTITDLDGAELAAAADAEPCTAS